MWCDRIEPALLARMFISSEEQGECYHCFVLGWSETCSYHHHLHLVELRTLHTTFLEQKVMTYIQANIALLDNLLYDKFKNTKYLT